MPIPESYWVIPARILAGEYPARFDSRETEQRIDAFLEAGLNAFIDLTALNEMKPYNDILMERASHYGASVSYQRFSIGNFSSPSHSNMIAILDTMDFAIDQGKSVYIHCWAGVGRTGTVVGCYLARHGNSADALNQLASLWKNVPKHIQYPHSPETENQINFVRQWRD